MSVIATDSPLFTWQTESNKVSLYFKDETAFEVEVENSSTSKKKTVHFANLILRDLRLCFSSVAELEAIDDEDKRGLYVRAEDFFPRISRENVLAYCQKTSIYRITEDRVYLVYELPKSRLCPTSECCEEVWVAVVRNHTLWIEGIQEAGTHFCLSARFAHVTGDQGKVVIENQNLEKIEPDDKGTFLPKKEGKQLLDRLFLESRTDQLLFGSSQAKYLFNEPVAICATDQEVQQYVTRSPVGLQLLAAPRIDGIGLTQIPETCESWAKKRAEYFAITVAE